MQCVIIAGGLATRLRPITEKIPKSMVSIYGKPFLEYQLSLLRSNGLRDFILCVGFLAEQIEDYFEDGFKFGVNISYSYEKGELLGTGGAIRNSLHLLEDSFFTLYGDSYLDIDYKEIHRYFYSNKLLALMTVYKNDNKWDESNVIFNDGIVTQYDKKVKTYEMKYIDYGLSILTKKVVERIPKNTPLDLEDLYKKLSKERLLHGFEVFNRFYEIGSNKGIKEFTEYIKMKGVRI